MSTRIRYVKSGDNTLKSMQVLKAASGDEYITVIKSGAGVTEGYVYKANNTTDHIAVVTATSLHKAKIKVKNILKGLGVSFGSETRKKRNETEQSGS